MARRSSSQFAANFEKSWLKARWITPSEHGRGFAQAFEVGNIAAMDLCARGHQGLGALFRTREPRT